jgi:Tfp pilus assembly protein PilF
MTAKAYLIRGMIYLRRPSLDEAIPQLRTALFWSPNMIEGHIALAKIYLEKGDCLQAKNYWASAVAIDKENKEVLGLQRQVEKCSK